MCYSARWNEYRVENMWPDDICATELFELRVDRSAGHLWATFSRAGPVGETFLPVNLRQDQPEIGRGCRNGAKTGRPFIPPLIGSPISNREIRWKRV